MTESSAKVEAGIEGAGPNEASLPTRRRATVDGEVFQWLRKPKPDGLGLSDKDVAIAGKILKGRGNPWTPWGLGALMAACHGTAQEPVIMAKKIAKGVVPEWACAEARKLLKGFEEKCAHE